MNYNEMSLRLHEEHGGKLEVVSKVPVKNRDDLSTAYTPGVAEPCRKISAKKSDVYKYTAKKNLVAVVTDGTAIVVAAGLINALKLVGKTMEEVRIVINGAGSAGISIAKLLLEFGAGNVVLVDRQGAVSRDEEWLNSAQRAMAEVTNPQNERGPLAEIIKGKDVFIGVSAPNVVTAEMVSTMERDAIVFAMANPVPEIMPEEAKKGGARVVATGRSDYPNQINNVLVFPGIFRGALDALATDITEEMKLAAAKAIAGIVKDEELKEDYIIPGAFHPEVAKVVAEQVARVAKELHITKEV